MSLLQFVKCEMCEMTAQGLTPPDGWYTLFQAGDTWHFHDEACLAIWRLTTLSMMPAQHEPQEEQSACKARRFLLWDESANSTEGVLWRDGSVILEDGDPPYETWDKFKERNPGSGVQWIDQEVAE